MGKAFLVRSGFWDKYWPWSNPEKFGAPMENEWTDNNNVAHQRFENCTMNWDLNPNGIYSDDCNAQVSVIPFSPNNQSSLEGGKITLTSQCIADNSQISARRSSRFQTGSNEVICNPENLCLEIEKQVSDNEYTPIFSGFVGDIAKLTGDLINILHIFDNDNNTCRWRVKSDETSEWSEWAYFFNGTGINITSPPNSNEVQITFAIPSLNSGSGIIRIDDKEISDDQYSWTSSGITLDIYKITGYTPANLQNPIHIQGFDNSGNKIFDICYPFVDVCPGQWFTKPIMKLWREGVLSGYTETTYRAFNPNKNANRAEYVKTAVVADEKANEPGREYSEYAGAFDDVNTDDWFAPYVQYAKDQSIIQGCETNLFCPGDTINRAEAVTVTDRTFDRLQTTLEAYKQGKTPSTEFTDVTDASKWYYPFVYTSMEKMLINGYKDGSFKPGNPVTRAEMAKINCIAAFGVKACMFTGEMDTPFVTSVFPRTAILDEPTTFTVRGYNLPETTAFWIAQCDNLQSLGGTAEEQKFTCTPSYEVGSKSGVVKDKKEGAELYPFTIQVFEEKPMVDSVSPLTATLNQEKIFTVYGSNLPDTLAFYIPECENLQKLSGTPEQYQFSCTPSHTAGIKDGLVKDMSGDSGNILKEFTVTVQDETTPADPGDDPIVDPGDDPVVDPGDDPIVDPDDDSVIGDPVIYSVKPLEATLSELTPFTVTGKNLPDTTAFWIAQCIDPIPVSGGTSELRKFTCTPGYETGIHDGVIKEKENGTILKYNFSVNFLWGTPKVDKVTPTSADFEEPTVFTVTGSSLFDTTALWIDECDGMSSLGGDANERPFQCTPSYKTGTKDGVVKDKSGDTGTVLKTFTVNVQ